MAVYMLTGRLGAGKSLAAVSKAVEYAAKGRRVVTNFFLDLAPVAHRSGTNLARSAPLVISARPTAADLRALGRGGPTEHEAGLLILDECATFLNSRQWQGSGRNELIEWFLHSRKLGWDIILIVQHQAMLDKQIRDALCEFLVTVRRLDKMKIPVISWLIPFKMPQVHIAQVRYGLSPNDPTADHWVFRGKNLYPCYSTEWISDAAEQGSYSVLPAELSKFRYQKKQDLAFILSLIWRLPFYLLCRFLSRRGLLRPSHYLRAARSVVA